MTKINWDRDLTKAERMTIMKVLYPSLYYDLIVHYPEMIDETMDDINIPKTRDLREYTIALYKP